MTHVYVALYCLMKFWKEVGLHWSIFCEKLWIQGLPPDWLLRLWHIHQLHWHKVPSCSLIDFAHYANSILYHRALRCYKIHLLTSWFVNRDSGRLNESRSYSSLPSLNLQGPAQAISGKKTNCDTDNTSIWVTAAALSDPLVLIQEIQAGDTDDCAITTSTHLDLLFSEPLL